MKPTEISEEEFYEINKEGIFYYKTDLNIHCKIVYKDRSQIIKNIWKNEKLAFEWMNQFITDFE